MHTLNDKTIAVVDDSPVVRAYVSFLLIKNNLSVVFEATDGQDCLSKIREAGKAPCVVILDIEMPIMDGFETALILKNDWPDTKIIAMSSKSDSSTIGQMAEAGADFFISKEGNITDALINTLNMLLN
ncbi:response regulator [Dyadobacter bucti]|uniref:response regulator n=1 Tax=Dyadobacter bucti TaxID=2572203 RepID=UPI001108B182|nr:response regulator [Dyadobacter bucti]